MYRERGRKPIPLGGGVAVFLATSLVQGVMLFLPDPQSLKLNQDGYDTLGFFSAGAVVLAVGRIDGHVGLRGRQKLLGQRTAAGLLAATGLVIDRVAASGGFST